MLGVPQSSLSEPTVNMGTCALFQHVALWITAPAAWSACSQEHG